MKRRFHTLDVFTETRLQGNPLAVVLDSAGLGDAEMQAIAREFNLAETVFVFPSRNPVNSAAVRIFTPTGELSFAGHPTVGTAVLLAHLEASDHMRGPGGVRIVLEEKIGDVAVDVSARPGRAARGEFSLPVLPEPIDWSPDVPMVARALGLDPLDLGFGAHSLSAWSAGVPFMFVPVRGLDVLGVARIADAAAWKQALTLNGRGAAYLYTRETTREDTHVRARRLSHGTGVTEDPATGSAVAAFAGLAVAFERPEPGLHQLVIEQGIEMGRPSEIVLDLDVAPGGALVGARIGGAAVLVSEGMLL
ncbi:MAG: PhzF family phenazine biosynthesis protein [Proteobacteria bacterium]|nr:PhzF family phenazine biosynthesis protein [Pseudomonadota bacterium]